MSTTVLSRQRVYGLFELDDEGKVLYSRLEVDGVAARPRAVFDGRNFFEAAQLLNAEELRKLVRDFRASGAQVSNVVFTCRYADGDEDVKVLLTRVRERSDASRTKSILMHVKKA
jgi:hypothetical protein